MPGGKKKDLSLDAPWKRVGGTLAERKNFFRSEREGRRDFLSGTLGALGGRALGGGSREEGLRFSSENRGTRKGSVQGGRKRKVVN